MFPHFPGATRRNPVGQREQDEGVEAETHLRAGRVQPHVEPPADPGPVRQRVAQRDAGHAQREARAHQAGGGTQVQRALHDAVEQQHREQEVVDEALHLLPDLAVERGEAADQVAAQDEREVGEEQLGEVHGASIASAPAPGRVFTYVVSRRRQRDRLGTVGGTFRIPFHPFLETATCSIAAPF